MQQEENLQYYLEDNKIILQQLNQELSFWVDVTRTHGEGSDLNFFVRWNKGRGEGYALKTTEIIWELLTL